MQKTIGWISGILLVLGLLSLPTAPLHAHTVLSLLGHLDIDSPANTDLIMGNGMAYIGEYAPSGVVHVIDVSDPTAPRELAVYRSSVAARTLDGQLKDNYLFVALSEVGFAVVDVSDPSHPRELTVFSHLRTREGVHNLFVAGDYAYLAAEGDGDLLIVNVSDPTDPRLVTVHNSPGFTHDITVVGDRAYLANLRVGTRGFGAFQILDVSNPARPRIIGQHDYPNGFCHNIWPSTDGQFVATTDEICGEGHLRIFDISNPNRIHQVGEYIAPDSGETTIHDARWVGNLVFMSYYQKGLRGVDVTDPTMPREVGFFETWDEETPLGPCFAGAWGVFTEELEGGVIRVYASDISSGLWIFDVLGG